MKTIDFQAVGLGIGTSRAPRAELLPDFSSYLAVRSGVHGANDNYWKSTICSEYEVVDYRKMLMDYIVCLNLGHNNFESTRRWGEC